MGIRQGCVLSPDSFNLYSEVILKSVLAGLITGGHNLNIRYIDGSVFKADTERKLK